MTEPLTTLLDQLTVAEKASLTSGSSFWYTAPVDRVGIPRIMMSDGPHGLRAQPDGGDHVGLSGSVPATCFPTASAIASSWDPALLRRIGEALAREARAGGLSIVLGPGINIKRSPLCGRNFEYFSEDPFLAGELGVGIVEGTQSLGVGTSVKHFAANNQETDRLRVDAIVDERTLREIYLPAFERVVTGAKPWTVMASYNSVNGLPATENDWLLTTVLRDEWGFDGVVISDWGAVYHRVPALAAGLDLEMPPALGRSPEQIVAAIESGELDEAVLDARARAVLELVDKGRHVLDLDESYDPDAHHALAREAATESIVLLKNDDDLLPLQPGAKLALIGEFARTPRFQGAGSSQVNPTRTESLLDELGALTGPDQGWPELRFAPGYTLEEEVGSPELITEAVAAAAAAEVAVVLIGLPGSAESEGFDREHLLLPADQLALLDALGETGTPLVVVLVNGSVVQLDEVTHHASALLEAWLGGQAAAGGIADVLTGRANPSGKLAETIGHRLEDNSSFLNFPGDSHVVRYGEGLFVGYRGYDKAGQSVAFPFGFGLSYTTFELSDLVVTGRGSVADDTLAASVEVNLTNTGARAGAEVVQVYVEAESAHVTRPVRELKGFAKVRLDPGETRRVRIELDQRAFSYWSPTHRRWVVESGEATLAVGTSSRDLPLRQCLKIEAPTLRVPLGRDSSLQEWLDDPYGAELIRAEVAAGESAGAMSGELLAVVGNFPLSTLANFEGMSLGHEALDRISARWAERES